LTIGYVSADFMAHPVAYFMGALLAAHDRRRFRVICYASVRGPDAVTRQVRKVAPEWRDVAHLGDEKLATLIAEDGVDILVDLGGHTASSRLTMFALKPAPVQVSYLGYPNTTGLAAIDYRLTDAWADPPGLTDRWHTEQLIRLPGGFLSYTPPANLPDVAPLPAASNGFVTFGSYNNFAKTSQSTIALWTAVLDAVPNSRLLLKASFLDDPGTAAEIIALFAAAGSDPQRITLRGRTRGHLDHIRSYGALDIALDPHPYNGTTTTCEALWMGVPVLTLAGDRHSSRVGTSILTAAGLDDFIAVSPEDYVARARSLSSDLQGLASLRLRLREQVAASPLADPKRLARAIEAAYLRLWRLRER
jgi:predicted O-linked N-acetylglucosamine transferase (SPINDLY family)